MLTKLIRKGFGSYNILNSIKNFKDALRAPVKHIKSWREPGGQDYNPQTNTTEEAFDEVSQEWQTMIASNPFDLMTFNFLENAQLSNFGTVDNPLAIFTADAPFRFVGCTGPQNEDDYEGHEPMWIMLREGPLQRCGICGQVFKLVRLRNQVSAEMDYYVSNFHPYEYQEMGQHDVMTLMSLHKMNTHYEFTYHEVPENSVYSMVNPDDHDRILVDPAYRMQKLALAEEKAKVIEHTLKELDDEAERNTRIRNPISKVDYENLIEAEVAIKKLDRNFRKVAKFESRQWVDPENHERREKRMLDRIKTRWDGAYTFFSGTLSEEEQRYRDYFETDMQNYAQDEMVEEQIDRENLLSKPRYNLNRFDFQQEYVLGNEDDQSSYLEKKIFKYKYRRALDSASDFERRNNRVISRQKERFDKNQTNTLIENYLRNPEKHESEYLKLVREEARNIYKDYFESDKDENLDELIKSDNGQLASIFENHQLSKKDRSSFVTLRHTEWDNSQGWWANTLAAWTEIPQIIPQAETASLKGHADNYLNPVSLDLAKDKSVEEATKQYQNQKTQVRPNIEEPKRQQIKQESHKAESTLHEAKIEKAQRDNTKSQDHKAKDHKEDHADQPKRKFFNSKDQKKK